MPPGGWLTPPPAGGGARARPVPVAGSFGVASQVTPTVRRGSCRTTGAALARRDRKPSLRPIDRGRTLLFARHDGLGGLLGRDVTPQRLALLVLDDPGVGGE